MRLGEELKRNEKERAEHVMLVDLGRNDIGRVCDYGTVRVPTFMALERYSHVMHLVSVVEGQLAEGRDRLDALVSCFPAGTVSGAPKVRAMQIINELEPTRRGLYAGAVGYLDFAGNLDFCIAIRIDSARARQGLHPGRRRHRRRIQPDRRVRRDARQGARDDPGPRARTGRVVAAMVLVIDNYDSFTYNLVQYLGELGAEVVVRRNDEATIEELRALGHARVVISPGPGRPEQAGVSLDVIKEFGPRMPLLGVCLGHQAIGLAFGGEVVRAPTPIHGKTSTVEHDGKGVFAGLASPFQAGRYHSLVVGERTLPAELEVTARTKDDDARDGAAASHDADTRRAVSSRIGAHQRRAPHPAQLPRDVTMFPALIEKLRHQEDLTTVEAAAAMAAIMRGEAAPAQIAGLLVGLSIKGERPTELVGFAKTMRENAVAITLPPGPVFDTCGTGGDRSGTFNISTASAIVLAACGMRIAKHGNRSVSSQCGSADVLEALGVNIQAAPAVVEQCLIDVGVAFLFAPTFHPAMKHAAQARKDLGVRTAFNLLGPLTNPARPTRQIVGVPRPELTELLARSLAASRFGAGVGRARGRWSR